MGTRSAEAHCGTPSAEKGDGASFCRVLGASTMASALVRLVPGARLAAGGAEGVEAGAGCEAEVYVSGAGVKEYGLKLVNVGNDEVEPSEEADVVERREMAGEVLFTPRAVAEEDPTDDADDAGVTCAEGGGVTGRSALPLPLPSMRGLFLACSSFAIFLSFSSALPLSTTS